MKSNLWLRVPGFGAIVFLLFSGGAACLEAAPGAPVRVLIFSGQNNHDWKTTTPKLKSILTQSGRFTVEVTERPDQCSTEALANCDVILSDWNSWGDTKIKEWPAPAREAFLKFVRDGKGYVSIHAGSSSFYDWPEYQRIGMLSWNLAATSHGPPHEFAVQFTGEHPITRGLASFKTKDELWIKPGVHPGAKVLATGDGQPLVTVTEFGKGRGFAMLLGHSADFMNTEGFQALLLRGVEWAATGKVTFGGASAMDSDAIIRNAAAYRFGDSRNPILALEKLVFAASVDPQEQPALAAKLADALAGAATFEGKRAFCEGLSLIGGAAEVPVLARTLSDTNLFDHVRQALERIPAGEAAASLEAALPRSSGSQRAGLIHSLAARRAESAVPAIANYIEDADREGSRRRHRGAGQAGRGQSRGRAAIH